jgi:hypothetical protein
VLSRIAAKHVDVVTRAEYPSPASMSMREWKQRFVSRETAASNGRTVVATVDADTLLTELIDQ